jgi:muconate cycloisomerase
MRISGIDIYRYLKPFEIEFHSSHTKRNNPDSLIIKIDFENGLYGLGEAVPRHYVTGEDCTTVASVIHDCFVPVLFSNEIKTRRDVIGLLEELENECGKSKVTSYNSALCAIEIALLDALGKLSSVPIGDFLGPTLRENIEYSVSVPFLSTETIMELYPMVKQFNFKHVKILLVKDESKNLERVGLIRSLLGDEVNLQVEANGSWTLREALSNIENLKDFNINAVEQPLPVGDLDSLIELRKNIDIPIVLDESICDLADAAEIMDMGAFDIINLKLSKCGGLIRSKEIADLASSHNIKCQLGSHVGETAILTNAGVHFAMTVPNVSHFAGSSFLLFQRSKREEKSQQENMNNGYALDRYGLGLETGGDRIIKDSRLMVSLNHGSGKKMSLIRGADPI